MWALSFLCIGREWVSFISGYFAQNDIMLQFMNSHPLSVLTANILNGVMLIQNRMARLTASKLWFHMATLMVKPLYASVHVHMPTNEPAVVVPQCITVSMHM